MSQVRSRAYLPMYDLEELRGSNDALWSFIAADLRAAGIDAPSALTRSAGTEAVWNDPTLLLGQTCGYPLMTSLRGRVATLATPCYSAPGCHGPHYRSVFIVRKDDPARLLSDLHDRRCAVNDIASNSGMNLLRSAIASVARGRSPFFGKVTRTGAHVASVHAVASGHADVAAIDCVTWAHIQHLRPAATSGLRVLCQSNSCPGLPLITSIDTCSTIRSALLDALHRVIQSHELKAVRAALLLEDFVVLPPAAYDVIMDLEEQARAQGYPDLR